MDSILRPALGEIAKLGDLYNIRSKRFTGRSIFGEFASVGGHRNEVLTKEITFIESDRLSERLKHLDVTDDLILNVLGGTIPVKGSAKHYLEQEMCHPQDVSCTLKYQITTVREVLEYETVHEMIFDEPDTTESTHFVASILWGSNLFATATYHNKDNREKADVLEILKTCFRFIVGTARGLDRRNLLESEVAMDSKFHFARDILTKVSYPNTVAGARDLIHSYAQLPVRTSRGHAGGTQLSYTLVPLSTFNLKYQKNFNTPKKLELDPSFIFRIVSLFDDILVSKQRLRDALTFHDSRESGKPISTFSEKEVKEIEYLESEFRNEFRQRVLKLQLQHVPVAYLAELIEKYEQHDLAPSKVSYVLEEKQSYQEAQYRAAMYKELSGRNVIFISKKREITSPDIIYNHIYNDSVDTFVLYTNFEEDQEDHWVKMLEMFWFLTKKRTSRSNSKTARFVYVDTDFYGKLDSIGKTVIHHYKDGHLVSSDVYRNNRKVFRNRSKILSIFAF